MNLSKYLNARPVNERSLNDSNDRIGIAGFKLDARISESETLENDIPTTPLEDGSYANDHIIRKPRVLMIEGEVGTMVRLSTPAPETLTRSLIELGTARLYDRFKTDIQKAVGFTTLIAGKLKIKLFEQEQINSGVSQETFITHMEKLYIAQDLFSVDTEKFGVMHDMAIKSFTKKRNNQEDVIQYSLALQQLEFVNTTTSRLKKNPSGSSADSKVKAGAQSGDKVEKPQSLLAAIF